MTTGSTVPERTCPRCKEVIAPVPIVYGLPDMDLADLAAAGRVRLGGCMVGPESPELACPSCDASLPWARDPGTAGGPERPERPERW